jgi:hypothetical protein
MPRKETDAGQGVEESCAHTLAAPKLQSHDPAPRIYSKHALIGGPKAPHD